MVFLLLGPTTAAAQERGWLWDVYFYGNIYPSSTLGTTDFETESQVYLLGNRVGYRFNRHVEAAVNVPVYFVSFCQEDASGVETCGDNNGLGDVGFSLSFTLENPVLNYYSTGTVRFPTGDEDKGLGAGATTASWSNTLSRRFHRTTPFFTVILANSLSQTSSFLRPFESRGFVTELSGGLEQELHRYVYVGGSLYIVFPSGTQTTFGRFTTPTLSAPVGARVSDIAFAPQQGETTGESELTRDNGGSLWGRFPVHRNVEFQIGYTRSVRLDLDVVTFGVYANVLSLLRP